MKLEIGMSIKIKNHVYKTLYDYELDSYREKNYSGWQGRVKSLYKENPKLLQIAWDSITLEQDTRYLDFSRTMSERLWDSDFFEIDEVEICEARDTLEDVKEACRRIEHLLLQDFLDKANFRYIDISVKNCEP